MKQSKTDKELSVELETFQVFSVFIIQEAILVYKTTDIFNVYFVDKNIKVIIQYNTIIRCYVQRKWLTRT